MNINIKINMNINIKINMNINIKINMNININKIYVYIFIYTYQHPFHQPGSTQQHQQHQQHPAAPAAPSRGMGPWHASHASCPTWDRGWIDVACIPRVLPHMVQHVNKSLGKLRIRVGESLDCGMTLEATDVCK